MIFVLLWSLCATAQFQGSELLFSHIKSLQANKQSNLFWTRSKQNRLYQLVVPLDLYWKRALSVSQPDLSCLVGRFWIIAKSQSSYYMVGPEQSFLRQLICKNHCSEYHS